MDDKVVIDEAWELIRAGSEQEGEDILRRLAECGNTDAKYALATLYESTYEKQAFHPRAKPGESTKWYEAAAADGHIDAAYRAAITYRAGANGVRRDTRKAARLMEQAANAGIVAAQRALGEMYTNGIGVEQDGVLAFKWHQAAALSGDHWSQYFCAEFLLIESPFGPDKVRSCAWFNVLTASDVTDLRATAAKKLDELESTLAEEEISTAAEMADKIIGRLAEIRAATGQRYITKNAGFSENED